MKPRDLAIEKEPNETAVLCMARGGWGLSRLIPFAWNVPRMNDPVMRMTELSCNTYQPGVDHDIASARQKVI